jgi:hypothetical protein
MRKDQIVRSSIGNHMRLNQTRPGRVVSGVVELDEILAVDCNTE